MMLTAEQLAEFQQLLPWQDGSRLSGGHVLGRGRKGRDIPAMDWRIQLLVDRLCPRGQRVLEVGNCEGVHTVQLAAHCGSVIGVEVRPRNVVCSLVRLWLHGVANAQIVLHDVEGLDEEFGHFDIICHIGVLYHLRHPVEHLFARVPVERERGVVDHQEAVPILVAEEHRNR